MEKSRKQWSKIGAWQGGSVTSVALSPTYTEDKIALAATSAGIFRSAKGDNRAGQWSLAMNGFSDPSALAVAKGRGRAGTILFASSEQGRLFRSDDLGASWSEIASWAGLGVGSAIALSPDFASDQTLFVATANGIFRTLDGGESWQEASFGLLDLDVICLAPAPDFAHSQTLWVAELAQRLGFNLANAFARHRKLLADFLQGAGEAVVEAVAEFEDAPLAFGEAAEDFGEPAAEEVEAGDVAGVFGGLVFKQVAEAGVVGLADGGLHGDGLLGQFEDHAHAFEGHFHAVGEFFGGGFAAQLLGELLLRAPELVDDLDHVDGDADGAGLVGDAAGDGLANPPRGVGGELVAAAVFEFLHALHEADVAFLNEVEEGLAAVGVFLGDGNDEAQVGFHHLPLGLLRARAGVVQLRARREEVRVGHARKALPHADFVVLGPEEGAAGGGVLAGRGSGEGLEAGLQLSLIHI